jgi:hypothetical protein
MTSSQWFCKALDRELGPVGLSEMVEMVREGTLKRESLVCRKGTDQWIPAAEIASLFRVAEKEGVQPAPAEPEPEAEQVASSSGAPPEEQTPRRGRRVLVWIGATALVVAAVALGLWRWSLPPTANPLATFSQVVGEGKVPQTEQFSFASPRKVEGIVVSYKCHSQSGSNWEQNIVALTLRRAGEVIGESFDSYESQTDYGDIQKVGFWHSEKFPGISLKRGDRVDLTVTVKAGDYRNWVSEIEIRPLREGVDYPDKRGFYGSQ